jgi:hypothetical protein
MLGTGWGWGWGCCCSSREAGNAATTGQAAHRAAAEANWFQGLICRVALVFEKFINSLTAEASSQEQWIAVFPKKLK